MNMSNVKLDERDNPTVQPLSIDTLLSHPLQNQFADACTPAEEEMFLKDLKAGQRTPIEVMPADADGKHVILDGHRRVSALRQLGKTHVNAVIRHDLAGASEAEIQLAFLAANLHRRHLSVLQRMRSARRIAELELARNSSGNVSRSRVKSRIARQVGISTRTLNRYLLATEAPVEVQRAVEDGRVTLVEAGKIALLPRDRQEKIADFLRRGVTRAELKQHLCDAGIGNANTVNHVRANDALASFLRTVGRGIDDLSGRINVLSPRFVASHLPQLQRAAGMLIELIDRADSNKSENVHETVADDAWNDLETRDAPVTSDTVSRRKSKKRN